jgi:2-oxoglutarate dehydrogenase E2 component (dihydrolipoamide succinyltransferase)
VAQWLKQPGDAVAVDEAVVELETDKVTLEVNATEAGVLAEIMAEEGASVEVGALLGRIGAAGGAASSPKASAKAQAPAKAEVEPNEPKTAAKPALVEPAPAKPAPAKPEEAEPAAARGNGAAEAGGDGRTMDLVVPTLGESVTEATVAQWLKQPGDAVKADEPLVELETDKVTLEVNAPADGVLQEIGAESGATVEVGALLGRISAGATGASKAPAKASAAPAAKVPAGESKTPTTAPAPSPTSVDPQQVRHSAPGGKIGKSDLLAFLQGAAGAGPAHGELSPAVRRMVTEQGLDPALIPGSGKNGRITKEDVQRYLAGDVAPLSAPVAAPAPAVAKAPAAPAPAPSVAKAPEARESKGREERVKMSRLRRTIADRLKEAQNTAAILTTFNEIDMSAVMALRSLYRDAFEKKHGVRLGFTSFFTKAAVAALKEVPAVNGEIDGDEIVYKYHYDIGMAVSTPAGLMVPVVRDCDGKSFAEIEQALGELAAKGRDGKLSLEEMQGGTFTITNGGVFGSLLSTPILNRPQSAILGLHKIEERPIAVKGEVVVRPMMYVALSYDHRIIDGREAVTFLVRVKENMEDPQRMLLDM